jgi:hypothetical protein
VCVPTALDFWRWRNLPRSSRVLLVHGPFHPSALIPMFMIASSCHSTPASRAVDKLAIESNLVLSNQGRQQPKTPFLCFCGQPGRVHLADGQNRVPACLPWYNNSSSKSSAGLASILVATLPGTICHFVSTGLTEPPRTTGDDVFAFCSWWNIRL